MPKTGQARLRFAIEPRNEAPPSTSEFIRRQKELVETAELDLKGAYATLDQYGLQPQNPSDHGGCFHVRSRSTSRIASA